MFPLSLLTNKYVLGAGIILAVLGYVFYSGYHDATKKYEEAQAQVQADARLQEVLIQQRDEVHVEAAVQQKEVVRTVIQKVVQNVDKIVDRPIYTNVCLDDDGLRDANAALTAGIIAKGTSGQVPGSNSSK